MRQMVVQKCNDVTSARNHAIRRPLSIHVTSRVTFCVPKAQLKPPRQQRLPQLLHHLTQSGAHLIHLLQLIYSLSASFYIRKGSFPDIPRNTLFPPPQTQLHIITDGKRSYQRSQIPFLVCGRRIPKQYAHKIIQKTHHAVDS